jgi:hypothetical protein
MVFINEILTAFFHSRKGKFLLIMIVMLREVSGPNRDEVKRDWRGLHNKMLHDLYSSPNIVRAIKLRRMEWAGRIARMGKGQVHARFW